ncbi:I17RC protein, partial [Halcyon senegalensis]|nr:I17RC protein [Halcyon senegalensis]
ADAKAWERLWARSRLVLHATRQALSCSLLAPCDIPAELVACWQPVPSGPCQALPNLQQPTMGQVSGAPWGARGMGEMQVSLMGPFCSQGPQEFARLRPHPNLCVQVGHPLAAPQLPHGQPQALTCSLGQVWSGGQVRLTQCLRDREYCWGVLPGRPDDILLIEFGDNANASLCALEHGACIPLASFASTGAGHPGLLEQELRRDVAAGQCRQIWHPENSTSTMLWACPLHKYLRTRWVLAWMGVLLGAACLLLLLLLKKEDVKGEQGLPGGCTRPGT